MQEKIRWGAERRLEFIEFRVFWEGGVNRGDITERFGVSIPQASSDLSQYQRLAPDNLEYNASEKRYVSTNRFKPLFLQPSASRYLGQLRSAAEDDLGLVDIWMGTVPEADVMPIPTRRVKAELLRTLLAALRQDRVVSVFYQSMNPSRPERIWRNLSPHALGFDGLRWHMRAYCHESRKFKDFLLSRCEDICITDDPAMDASQDRAWHEFVDVILAPNPKLSASQQQAIADDYEMSDGTCRLRVRRALLYYLNRRLRLDFDVTVADPAENPLVVLNRDEFDLALSAEGGVVQK